MWRFPFSSLFGACIGIAVVMFAPSIVEPITDLYDKTYPVAEPVSTVVLGRDDVSILVQIIYRKNRGKECMLRRWYADTIDSSGERETAFLTRPDGITQHGITHDAGQRNLGVWSIQPVDKTASSVEVLAEYFCGGRTVKATIARFEI